MLLPGGSIGRFVATSRLECGAASLVAAPYTAKTYYCFMFTAVCIIWSAVVIVLALAW